MRCPEVRFQAKFPGELLTHVIENDEVSDVGLQLLYDRMIEGLIGKIEVKFSRYVGRTSPNILATCMQVAVDGKDGVESTTLSLHDQ
jgi:hypothetical protein